MIYMNSLGTRAWDLALVSPQVGFFLMYLSSSVLPSSIYMETLGDRFVLRLPVHNYQAIKIAVHRHHHESRQVMRISRLSHYWLSGLWELLRPLTLSYCPRSKMRNSSQILRSKLPEAGSIRPIWGISEESSLFLL